MNNMNFRRVFRDLPKLETDRLILKKISVSDAEDMYSYASLNSVTRFLLWSPHLNIEDTRGYIEFLNRQYKKGTYADWGVFLKSEGRLIGTTGFADFDFEKGTVSISKSYQRMDKRDVITEPKTPKSNRIIKMPDFLTEEIQEYVKQLYGVGKHERLFPISKNYLHREMKRGADEAGVKRIRIHDLRHSHISLLIEMGYSAVAIADRVGHESINITYNYAHLFPSTQHDMADKLNQFRKAGD